MPFICTVIQKSSILFIIILIYLTPILNMEQQKNSATEKWEEINNSPQMLHKVVDDLQRRVGLYVCMEM